jgi:hypothetical protein
MAKRNKKMDLDTYKFLGLRFLNSVIIMVITGLVIFQNDCADENNVVVPPTPIEINDCHCPAWSPKNDYIAFCYHPYDTSIPEDTLGLYLYAICDSTYFKILDIKL